jgi:HK97 family phage major capsid protein
MTEEIKQEPEAQEEATEEDVAKSVREAVKKSSSEAVDEIKAEVKTWMMEQKDLMEKKAGIYNGEVKDKRAGINQYLRKMASALVNQDIATLKEMTTDATASPFAGFVVDSELSAEIRHLMTEYGVAMREMNTVQLTKGSYDANALVTDVTVNWVDEAGAIGSTQAVLGQEELKLKKLAAIVTLTRELLDDQEIDLFSFIGGRVAEGFAKEIDTQFFAGDGTVFTGVLNNANVNTVTLSGATIAGMDADDLLDMEDATPQGALANGKFYMHRTIKNIVRKLKDNDGQYIYQRPSEGGPATIWGYPVVLVEAMPGIADDDAETAFVIFGDLKKATILGFQGAIVADRFNAGVIRNVAGNADINLITTDREAIRWIQRIGYITILPKAVTVLKTGAES